MSFRRHTVQKHEETKPFNCDKCTFKCYARREFKRHYERIHTRERNCDICGSTFTSKEDLEEHQISNHSIKCKFCDKMFYVKHHKAIQKHMKEEHESKPCQICGKAFQHLNALNSHMKTFHDIDHVATLPKAVCQECGKLVNKASMNQHMAFVHKVSLNLTSMKDLQGNKDWMKFLKIFN